MTHIHKPTHSPVSSVKQSRIDRRLSGKKKEKKRSGERRRIHHQRGKTHTHSREGGCFLNQIGKEYSCSQLSVSRLRRFPFDFSGHRRKKQSQLYQTLTRLHPDLNSPRFYYCYREEYSGCSGGRKKKKNFPTMHTNLVAKQRALLSGILLEGKC